jgi:hypothetical protein
MMRRLVLTLLPVAGVVLGLVLAAVSGPAPAGALLPIGGSALAFAVLGGVALAAVAAWLAAAGGRAGRPAARRRPAIPRSRRPASQAAEPPTVSGYWRAHDEPDWPEGEVRRERASEEEPVRAGR